AGSVGDARGVDLARDARKLAERRKDGLPVIGDRLQGVNPRDQFRFVRAQAATEHAAVDADPSDIPRAHLNATEGLRPLLDAHQRLRSQVSFIEEQYEDAVHTVVGLPRMLADHGVRTGAKVARYHVELLDLLRFSVLEQLKIVGTQSRNEVSVFIEDDGIDL